MILTELPLAFDVAALARFCEARGVQRLALFGSVVRPDFRPGSDVDVLVEYLPGQHPGLMLFRHQDELSTLIGRTVDLHTAASLSPHFRDAVLAEALSVYEQE